MDRKYRHQQERIQTLTSCQASLIKWRLTIKLQVYLIGYLIRRGVDVERSPRMA